MIQILNNFIKIDTEHTTLLLAKRGVGVEKLYFGKKLKNGEDYSIFSCKNDFHASVDDDDYFCSVFSCGDGNDREKFVCVRRENFAKTDRFRLVSAEIIEPKTPKDLPAARNRSQTLELRYQNEENTLTLCQYFSVFSGCNIISSFAELKNESGEVCYIETLASLQMDFYGDGEILTLCGSWGAERKPIWEKNECGCKKFFIRERIFI